MKALPSRKTKSEAEKFASWFQQDFGALGAGNQAVATYIAQLGSSERAMLKAQLQALLREHPGKDQRGLGNAWRRLGAQWSPRGSNLRAFIERWIGDLN